MVIFNLVLDITLGFTLAYVPMESQTTKEQAQELIQKHGRGQPNFLNWQLHNEYLDLPKEEREKMTFHEYVVRELSK